MAGLIQALGLGLGQRRRVGLPGAPALLIESGNRLLSEAGPLLLLE